MRRSVKATTGVFGAALITATCTAALAPAATYPRTVGENSGPAYFKMTGVTGHPFTGTAIAVAARSSISDPGCTTAGNAGRQMTNTFNADEAAISRDQNNAAARRADLQRLVADLQLLQRQLAIAAARATHQSVKAGISAMISDLSTFTTSLHAVENGNVSQVNRMATAAYKMQSDGHAAQATCTGVSAR